MFVLFTSNGFILVFKVLSDVNIKLLVALLNVRL